MRSARVEPQRRWKLNEERSERLAQSRDLTEKPRQRLARRGERARSWLIRLGILTEKRNDAGTAAAQRW